MNTNGTYDQGHQSVRAQQGAATLAYASQLKKAMQATPSTFVKTKEFGDRASL